MGKLNVSQWRTMGVGFESGVVAVVVAFQIETHHPSPQIQFELF